MALKKQHGGKRKGAGRKPTGRKPFVLYCTPDAWERLRSYSVTPKETPGAILERITNEQLR